MAFFKQFPKVDYDLYADGAVQSVVNIFRNVRPLQNFIDDMAVYKFYTVQNGERPDIVSQRLYGTPDFYWTFFVVNEFLHDGTRAWPMSEEVLADYINTEYSGFAINTHPTLLKNSDGTVNQFVDSLSGRFKLGEQITGLTSGAAGILVEKNIDLNQLIIKQVNGTFVAGESVRGSITSDVVQSEEVFVYSEAPHHYFQYGDTEERHVTNRNNIDSEQAFVGAQLDYTSNRAHLRQLNDERSRIRIVKPEAIAAFVDEFERLLNA